MKHTPYAGYGNKPRVYSPNHAPKKFACQYYRIDVPLESLHKMGYAITWNDTLAEGSERAIAGMTQADFDVFWGIGGEDGLYQLKVLRDMEPRQMEGRLRVPPILIFDTDDNRDYIHPLNTAFCEQGVRAYPDTKLLTPGSTVWTTDANGERVPLWEDEVSTSYGKTFSITRNLQEMETTHQIMHTCHGVTVSTPNLARYVKNVLGIKHVHVFPNTVIPEHYVSYPLVPHAGVRLLWQGGMSHYVDWFPLRDAVREVCRRYPDVTWVIFGEQFDWITSVIPKIEQHSWVDYSAYKMKRALLRVDINLCPLADDPFNRCKSAIKWYEASVWDKPEATLAARVPPYSDEMQDGETGLLYRTPEEFVEKLSLLIEDAQLRKRLGHNAKKWILANRTPEHTVPSLWEFYQDLQQRRIGEYLLSQGASQTEIKRLAREQGITR